ncbi:MAG: 16S rRNA (cytosine(1402)-N(4))-methyltransferase RsmH, partial [bacterium]
MAYQHQSVLLEETIDLLAPQSNQNYIDCTLGGGGHTRAILERTGPQGKVLAIDLDQRALDNAKKELAGFTKRVILVQDNYQNINKIKNEFLASDTISGILADLGLSSDQLQAGGGRGFSFQVDQPLDMRLADSQELTAEQIVNTYSEEQLFNIFKDFGQEKLARLIAQKITAVRRKQKIKTTFDLANLILEVYRDKLGSKKEIPWIGGLHPATKVFQALRIAVNDELDNLKKFLEAAVAVLPTGGRLAVITFHSLEDRIVKQFFRQEAKDCLCPPAMPVCQCRH